MSIGNKVRMALMIPEEIYKELEMKGGKRNKSRYVIEAIKEKLIRDQREKLNNLLKEGYKKAKKEDRAIDNDWEAATIGSWH